MGGPAKGREAMHKENWDVVEQNLGVPVSSRHRVLLDRFQASLGDATDREFLDLLIFVAVSFGPGNAFKLRSLKLPKA
jgi:hypothetical protein